MPNKIFVNPRQIPAWLLIMFICSLVLGLILRFYHLDEKVYSFDETYSSTYIFGQHSLAYQNFDSSILTTDELKKYVFIDPNKTLIAALQGVMQKIYIFPPVYPVLTLIWSYLLENSGLNPLVIQRSLTALLSVIILLGVYYLGIELFASRTTALVAVGIMAISPFHLQYAQIIRPYSILAACTVIASACLLTAMRVRSLVWWGIYGLSVVIGLYSNVLFGFVLLAHTIYVLIQEGLQDIKKLTAYFSTLIISVLLFLPWLWAFTHSSMLAYSVDQVSERVAITGLANAWFKGIQNLFIDLYNPFFSPSLFKGIQVFFTPIILAIALTSLYSLCRYAPKKVRDFLLALIIAAGVSLMVKDLFTGSSISSRMRYMIPFALGIELIVAYLIGTWLNSSQSSRRRWGQFAFSILLICGLASCVMIAQSPSWNAFGSPYFPKVAKIINAANNPLVLCTNLDRALSMSHLVDADTKFKLIRDNLTIPDGFNTVFALEVSAPSLEKLAKNHQIIKTYPQGRLLEIKKF